MPYGFTVDRGRFGSRLAADRGVACCWRPRHSGCFAGNREIATWWIGGLILLIPSSSLFPAADLSADRRMYLPMFCFAAAARPVARAHPNTGGIRRHRPGTGGTERAAHPGLDDRGIALARGRGAGAEEASPQTATGARPAGRQGVWSCSARRDWSPPTTRRLPPRPARSCSPKASPMARWRSSGALSRWRPPMREI